MRNWQKGNIYHIYYILYYNLLDNCCFCEYFKQDDGGPDQRFWYLTNDSSNLWLRYARTNLKCMEYNISEFVWIGNANHRYKPKLRIKLNKRLQIFSLYKTINE